MHVKHLLLLLTILLMSNELSYSNNKVQLSQWDVLSTQFEETLLAHEKTLNELYQKLQTSESNGESLTNSLEILSQQNHDLKIYNEQIALRMQERDQDLYEAYKQIDVLNKYRVFVITLIIGLVVIFIVRVVVR